MKEAGYEIDPVVFRIISGETIMANGDALRADFEQMSNEAETTNINVERLFDRQRREAGRPALGNGTSPALRVRLDEQLRQKPRSHHVITDRSRRHPKIPSHILSTPSFTWVLFWSDYSWNRPG
jgi:hypothetical protein